MRIAQLKFFAVSFLFLCIITSSIAQADTPPSFQDSVQIAIDNAAAPKGWIPQDSSIILIPDTSGTNKYDLRYTDNPTNHNLIVRSLTKSTFFTASDYAGKDHTIFKPPVADPQTYNADFVTTGNDATNFLDNHGVTGTSSGVTGVDTIKLLERGLGITNDGTHDAIVEYTIASDPAGVFINKIMRPMKNPDITSYSKEYMDFADLAGFQKPADMTADVFTYFQNFYNYWRNKAYHSALAKDDFPWTQLGYTFLYGNGSGLPNIQGMSEFILLGGTVVNTYAMYSTQSYIYAKAPGDTQYGNGYASFDVYGSCDSIWAGHRFQAKTLDSAAGTNTITIEKTGSVSGGQGILVYSLNYKVTNNGSITGATANKFGYASTSNIAVLFLGNTDSTYLPAPTGSNSLTNSGTISSPGTAIMVANGDTVITNNAGGTISGTTAAIDCSASPGAMSITNRGTITNGITLAAATPTTLDVGNTSLTLKNGHLSALTLTANSPADFGSITTAGTSMDASSAVNVTIGGYIPNGTTFQVINTTAGITAVPGTIASSSPIFTFSGDKSTNNLILTATRAHTYNSYATSANAGAAGSVLNTLAANNTATGDMVTVLGALDSLSSAGQINQALNSLLPNTDNSVPQASYETQNQFINTVLSHFDNVPSVQTAGDAGAAVMDNDARTMGVWAQGFDTYLHQDPRGLSNGYDANVVGTSMGYDVPVIGDFICGLNAGYAWNNIRTKDSGARTTANNYQGSLYGSFSHDSCYVDGILSFAYDQYHSTRHVSFGGLDRIPTSDYGGQQYSAYLESGYTFKNKLVTLTPLGSVQYMHLHVNGHTEERGGATDLTVAGQDYDMFQTGLGARLSYKIIGKDYTLIPDIHVKWLYDFIGDNQQATSTFTGGGASFATNGFTPAQSSYDLGTRWVLLSKPNITLSLNYDFEIKEDFYSHSGYGNVRYDF